MAGSATVPMDGPAFDAEENIKSARSVTETNRMFVIMAELALTEWRATPMSPAISAFAIVPRHSTMMSLILENTVKSEVRSNVHLDPMYFARLEEHVWTDLQKRRTLATAQKDIVDHTVNF
jgi:hypothetical protein